MYDNIMKSKILYDVSLEKILNSGMNTQDKIDSIELFDYTLYNKNIVENINIKKKINRMISMSRFEKNYIDDIKKKKHWTTK